MATQAARRTQPTASPEPPAPPVVDDALVAEVAAEADTDPRSVVRRIAGLRVAGRPGRRIDAALVRRGLGGR